MTTTKGFSLIEVVLAMAVVALVLAVLVPAVVGAVRAQRQANGILEPLAEEQVAFGQLRDDLWAAMSPGTLGVEFTVVAAEVGGNHGATLGFTTRTPPPIHYQRQVTPAALGQATVTWGVQPAADGRGMAWTRSSNTQLLATGSVPAAVPEVMLDHLSSLTIEALSDGTYDQSYDSGEHGGLLPAAVRITYSRLGTQDATGPLQVLILDLPQVALGGGL